MIPIHSNNSSWNENSFGEIGDLAWNKRAHSRVSRKQHFRFLLEQRGDIHRNQRYCEELSAVGKRVWQSSALVRPTKIPNRDGASIGSDIETVQVPREDIRMGIEEGEEPLEAEIPGVRTNRKNPTNREKRRTRRCGSCCLQKLVCRLCRRKKSWWATSN